MHSPYAPIFEAQMLSVITYPGSCDGDLATHLRTQVCEMNTLGVASTLLHPTMWDHERSIVSS